MKKNWPKNMPGDSTIWKQVVDRLVNGDSEYTCNALRSITGNYVELPIELKKVAIKHYKAVDGYAWWGYEEHSYRIQFAKDIYKLLKRRENKSL